jgi:peptidoglycan/xylan/chitin deacetylase (PgdA/CDA1 family)
VLLAAAGAVAAALGAFDPGGGGSPAGRDAGATSSSKPAQPASTEPPLNAEPLAPSRDPLPILMYHVIADPPADAALPELFVKPAEFKAQLAWLGDNGYSAVTLDQVDQAWHHGGELPRKPVVISMDDGYRGQYVYALPDLRRYHWPAVLNLKVNSLDPGGELSEKMVKAMIAAGWEIDAHTIDHLDVSMLSGAELRHQIAGSRQILRKRFAVPVNFFCYPAGRYDAESVQAVKDAGYLGATTVDPGLASPAEMFTLKRIRISLGDRAAGLAEKLRSPASAAPGGPA